MLDASTTRRSNCNKSTFFIEFKTCCTDSHIKPCCVCKVSGLSHAIGTFFENFRDFPAWLLALLLSALTAIFTEVTSNVATTTIFLPIVAELVNRSVYKEK